MMIIFVLFLSGALLALLPVSVLLIIIGGACGLFLVDCWLNSRKKKRDEKHFPS